MNNLYRVILSNSLHCFVVAFSASSYASNPQRVDNTSATYNGETVMTARAESAMIVSGSEGNVLFNNGYISASAPTSNAVQAEDGATFDIRNSQISTFQSTTLSALGGSIVKLTNTMVSSLAGPVALLAGQNSVISGNTVTLNSGGNGLSADNASVDITNLKVTSTGAGINASSGSEVNLSTASVTTNGSGGHGIYADGSTVNASNIVIATTGASARGVLASGANTQVTLNGGSISTQGANGHAIQATQGAVVNVSNMDLTTTAMRQAGDNGAAAIYANTGATVKADSLNLTSAGNAIWINNARVDGNNLHLQQTTDAYGPMIWGLAGSQLNLTNSTLVLGEGMAKSLGIFVDAGTANLNGVSISGSSGGQGVAVRYDGTLKANHLDIAIQHADNAYATGVYLSRGSGNGSATIENSKIVVNGSNAAGIRSDVAMLQTVNLNNTLITSDNVAVKADASSSLQLNAAASTLTGNMLIQGGTANSTNAVVGFIKLNATQGSQLTGDASIDRLYTADSLIALDDASVWTGAARGLHQLALSHGSRWTMTANSNVGSLNLAESQIAFAPAYGGFKTLTVDGNFTGNNGTLVMNSVLEDDASAHDRLIVNGDTSGITQVVVNNAGGNGAKTLQGIELISVAGDSRGEFRQQGRIAAGAYDYWLRRGAGANASNWYLNNSMNTGGGAIVRPEVGSYIANMAANNTLFNLRLHDRGGETQYVDALTGEQKVTSLWLRTLGGHQQAQDSSGQLKTETNRYVLQLGGDLATGSTNGTDSLHLGAMAGYGNAQSRTDSGITGYRAQGHTNGYNLGVYGTWYQQADQQTGAWVDSWLQYSWFNNTVNGEQLAAERYQSSGFTASLESGYRWQVGQDSHINRYFIEPNAQFIWMGVNADDVTETNGTRVSSQGNGNIQSRLGVRASLKTPGTMEQAVFTPYLEANWISNSKAFGSRLNDVAVSREGEKNIAELRVGLDSQLKSNLNIWGSLGQQAGSNQYRDTSAAVGVKLSF